MFYVAAPKASAQPHLLRECISPDAFATMITGVIIIPRAHHGEAHNASRVGVIVAYDMRVDLVWVHKDNAGPTR